MPVSFLPGSCFLVLCILLAELGAWHFVGV